VGDLGGIEGIVALGAGGTALLGCAGLTLALRRLRRAQRVVLGDQGERDLIAHAVELRREFAALRDYVDDQASSLDERTTRAETALARALAGHALVRYDAYGELSGHQSSSVALVDAGGSGVVLSSILHRDQARLYAKTVREGKGVELDLAPEEADAVRRAMSG